MTTMTDLQIDKWVQEANDDTNREFRQAVHTTLLAISSDNALKNNMVLKGGILLAIRYRSNRFTKDIDLSTTNHLSSMVPEDIISEINQSLALAVNILNYDLDCIVQGWKIEPRTENVTYPSIKITIGYAYKGTNKHKRLLAKHVDSHSKLTRRGCGVKLGLLGGSSCIHMKIAFEQSSFISSSENALARPFGS